MRGIYGKFKQYINEDKRSTEGLDMYDETKGDNQRYCTISQIIVPTEHDKEQLLKAFRYIHDLREIDSDYMAVNTIMHLYNVPDLIKVNN